MSWSTLSHGTAWPPAVAEKFETQRAKYVRSYAPGVHAGSESSTGPLPARVIVVVT